MWNLRIMGGKKSFGEEQEVVRSKYKIIFVPENTNICN